MVFFSRNGTVCNNFETVTKDKWKSEKTDSLVPISPFDNQNELKLKFTNTDDKQITCLDITYKSTKSVFLNVIYNEMVGSKVKYQIPKSDNEKIITICVNDLTYKLSENFTISLSITGLEVKANDFTITKIIQKYSADQNKQPENLIQNWLNSTDLKIKNLNEHSANTAGKTLTFSSELFFQNNFFQLINYHGHFHNRRCN